MHISPLSWITIICGASAALIIVVFLIVNPPFTTGVRVWLGFGLGVLPILAAMAGNIEGLEATKHRQFCGGCHVMGAHFEDILDPTSDSLAAVHSRNKLFGEESCYTCHSDYGMFGTVVTKLGGLGHVYYYLKDYRNMSLEEALPTIHIKKPYPNSNCMQCHSTETPYWNGVPSHQGLEEDLRTGQTSCAGAGCHGYAHPFTKTEEHAE